MVDLYGAFDLLVEQGYSWPAEKDPKVRAVDLFDFLADVNLTDDQLVEMIKTNPDFSIEVTADGYQEVVCYTKLSPYR